MTQIFFDTILFYFRPTFLGPNHFGTHNLLDTKSFGPNFVEPKCFRTKNLLEPYYFGPKIFMDSNFFTFYFFNLKSFGHKIFLDSKTLNIYILPSWTLLTLVLFQISYRAYVGQVLLLNKSWPTPAHAELGTAQPDLVFHFILFYLFLFNFIVVFFLHHLKYYLVSSFFILNCGIHFCFAFSLYFFA